MNKIKHKLLLLTAALTLTTFLSSCMMTKTSVGTYRETKGSEYLFKSQTMVVILGPYANRQNQYSNSHKWGLRGNSKT
jgi:hypothetical protein